MKILTLEGKPAQIFGQPLFPPTGGSRFNTKLTVLQHTAKCREHTELAEFYGGLIERGLKNSDGVVNYIKALDPSSINDKDRELLDQAIDIPMKKRAGADPTILGGLGVHLDIAGEASVKHGQIRGSSYELPATIPFTNQRPAWLVDNGQVERADAA